MEQNLHAQSGEGTPEMPPSSRPKRKRIERISRPSIDRDPLSYEANTSSNNARRIISVTETLKVEIWFDKHYIDRVTVGDEHGKREGIDFDTVQSLVTRAMPHLLFYSASVQMFTFLNKDHDKSHRANRIVLQEEGENGQLNVVVEVHYRNLNYYEMTVITAICKQNAGDFIMSDGQYAVYIDGQNSQLFKLVRRVEQEIASI